MANRVSRRVASHYAVGKCSDRIVSDLTALKALEGWRTDKKREHSNGMVALNVEKRVVAKLESLEPRHHGGWFDHSNGVWSYFCPKRCRREFLQSGSNRMALRVRFQYATKSTLLMSIEQLSTGRFYDTAVETFIDRAKTTNMLVSLPEDTNPFIGRYTLTMFNTLISVFADGDYVVTIHDGANNDNVVAQLAVTMFNGDDATVLPD